MPSDDLPERPLTVPLLIRGSFDNGLFVLCTVVGVICSLLAPLLAYQGDAPAAVVLALLALGTGGPAVVMGLWLRHQREWIEVSLTGFVLTGKAGRRAFSDGQVVGLSRQVARGADGKAQHRLVLEIGADETERIDCGYTVPTGQEDPLAGFVARLVAALAEGGELRGEGWALEGDVLRRRREAHALDALSCVGFYDGNLCLWRGDDERPFLRLPEGKRNVLPLAARLAARVRRAARSEPQGLPLGRLLLERRSWGLFAGMLVAVLGGCGAYYWLSRAAEAPPGERAPFGPFAVVCAALGFIGVVAAWCGRYGRLRFHERGVAQTGRLGTRRLAYEQIGRVRWKKGPVLVLEPLPGLGLRRIVFRTLGGSFDPELEAMRDFSCRHMAREWAERMAAGPVEWTARLRLLPGGLEYRPGGLLGAGEPVSVPYSCCRYRIALDKFVLLAGEGEGKAVFEERIDGANFFVGLLAFDEARRRSQGVALPEAGGHVPRVPGASPEGVTPGQGPGVRRSREG